LGEEDLAGLETEGADLCLEQLGFFGCFVGQFVYDLVDIDLVAFVHFSIFNLFKLILRPAILSNSYLPLFILA
jgi:hypothetical protein